MNVGLRSVIITLALLLLWGGCAPSGGGTSGSQCPPGTTYHPEVDRCIIDEADVGPSDASLPDAEDASEPWPPPQDVDRDADQQNDADADDGPNDTDADDGTNHADADDGTNDVDDEPQEPLDPSEYPDCGGDLWDSNHDGSNPWDPFEIDCEKLAASWDCQATEDELLILELINELRQEEQECGSTTYGPSQPMEMNAQLQCAARIHSWDMAGRGYYSHDTPEGTRPSDRVSIVGGSLSSAAENIYDFWGTPEGAVQGWMNSSGHCRNMMCGSYTQIGVARFGTMYTLKMTGPGICW